MSNHVPTLEEFDNEHGHVVTNALSVYIEYMRRESQNAQAAYDAIKDDEEKRTAQDKSLITTMGLFYSTRLFSEAANQAEAALSAYHGMTEGSDDEQEMSYEDVRDITNGW